MDYMRLACDAGFGGVLRNSMAPRLKKLVELAIEAERKACADLCVARGDEYKNLGPSEFHDGQMDGAYACSELIINRK